MPTLPAAPPHPVRQSGLRFRLDPTNVQSGMLLRAAGARRKAYNDAVATIRDNHTAWAAQREAGVEPKDRVKPPSAISLRAGWKTRRPDWHADHSSWVYDFAAREAAAAQANFLSGRARFPRFAKRGRTNDRFTIIGRDAPVTAGSLKVPKIGTIRIASPDPAQARVRRLVRRGRARITSVTISRCADGTWWAACKVERELRTPALPHSLDGAPVVGVDRGVKTLAVVADAAGTQQLELPSSRVLRDQARRLGHAQRVVARRTVRGKESSKNRVKAVRKVGRLHARVGARRADTLHAFSARLTRDHPTIVLETLTTKNLMANRNLAAAIADQGWGELARQVTYKAAWRGGTVLVAPRFFPSSKTCSGCGAVKPKLPLSVRLYTCDSCGLVLDRDVNAAATLAAWGEHQQGACPCAGGSQVRDRHPGGRSDADPAGLPRHACGGWVSGSTTFVVVPVLPDEAGTSLSRTRVA